MFYRQLFVAGLFFSGLVFGAVFVAASPFGINAHLPNERLLDESSELGVGWIRIDFLWSLVESEQDLFDWSLIDKVVAGAEERDLRIFASVGDTPAWATSGPPGAGVPADPRDWWDVCYRAASRYRGRIAVWGLWNEPNLGRFWVGTREEYLDIVVAIGADAIRQADPMALVAGPDLAHIDSVDWDGWLLEILVETGDALDIVTHHVYPEGLFAAAVTRDLEEGGANPWDAPSVKKILKDGGWWGQPFWLTETGLESDAGGEFVQADFYRMLIEEWFPVDGSTSWVDGIFFYQLADDPNFPEHTFGVLGTPPNFVRKQAFDAYRIYGGRIEFDDAAFLSFASPNLLAPGVAATFTIEVRNEGNTTWVADEGRHLVMTGLRSDWLIEGGSLAGGGDLAPGEIGEIRFSVIPPMVAEDLPNRWYPIRFRMARTDGEAFGLPGRATVGFGWRELPTFHLNPVTEIVEEGGTADFRVAVADATGPEFRWLHHGWPVEDGETYEGARTSRLKIHLVDRHTVGEYRCRVTTSAGTTTSKPAWLVFPGGEHAPRAVAGRAGLP